MGDGSFEDADLLEEGAFGDGVSGSEGDLQLTDLEQKEGEDQSQLLGGSQPSVRPSYTDQGLGSQVPDVGHERVEVDEVEGRGRKQIDLAEESASGSIQTRCRWVVRVVRVGVAVMEGDDDHERERMRKDEVVIERLGARRRARLQTAERVRELGRV